MKAEFWHERWEKDQIGFHQPNINDFLQRWFGELGCQAGDTVFVPLCGKSRDMLWLREQGCRVVGVELSERACEDFFSENGLRMERERHQDFIIFRSEGIELYCGDLFRFSRDLVSPISAAYDRGSLVALPWDMRRRYARHLAGLLDPGARVLLITLDYDQQEMDGPPFSVPNGQVQELLGDSFDQRELDSHDALEAEPHFRAKGLTRLVERALVLEKRG